MAREKATATDEGWLQLMVLDGWVSALVLSDGLGCSVSALVLDDGLGCSVSVLVLDDGAGRMGVCSRPE